MFIKEIWNAVYVLIYDNANNYKQYYRSENEELLSKFDFTVEEFEKTKIRPSIDRIYTLDETKKWLQKAIIHTTYKL